MDKPITRLKHCANCKYSVKKEHWGEVYYYCNIRYINTSRAKAIFCKYYKECEEK